MPRESFQYDGETNQIIGFVLPLSDENGLPVPFSFPARNPKEIMQYFETYQPVSSLVNVIMAQPIGIKYSSPFRLMIFGSDNRYTATDVFNRWNFVENELRKLEIHTLVFSSDCDTRYLAAMRKSSFLGVNSKTFDRDWLSCGHDFNAEETKVHSLHLKQI